MRAEKRKVNKQSSSGLVTEELDWERESYSSHLDVLRLYSSNSAFIGISRNFANDLTDFYAIKLEWSILINCSDLLHTAQGQDFIPNLDRREMHNIWVSRTSTTILIFKCQVVLAGENRLDDGQFWILRGFVSYWEILGCVKQADWASFHVLLLIIFTLLEFPCCAKSCPGVSLLPRSNLSACGNWGRVILTCKRRGHMLHANERATA